MDHDILHKEWGGCSKKTEAREITIVETYRELFGQKLPEDRQHWTLCGRSYSDESTSELIPNLAAGCELDQLLKEGLIHKKQFRGVERLYPIHQDNLKVPGVRWLHGDLLTVMQKSFLQAEYHPGIVNYDSIERPTTNPKYTGEILKLVTDTELTNVLVVVNVVMHCRFHKRQEPGDILDALDNTQSFRHALQEAHEQGNPWKLDNKCFTYNGTGTESNTEMASIWFYR